MTQQYDPSWEQHSESFRSLPQDFHNLPPTEFYESDLLHLRTIDFPEDIPVMPRREEREAPTTVEPTHAIVPLPSPAEQRNEVQFMTAPPAKSFREIAIARSVKGDSQVSLISEMEDGEHKRYAVKFNQLYRPKDCTPRLEHTMALTPSAIAGQQEIDPQQLALDMPLSLDASLAVFNGVVETSFPPIRLKNDRVVPTHVRLL